jgi:hypothetical protein
MKNLGKQVAYRYQEEAIMSVSYGDRLPMNRKLPILFDRLQSTSEHHMRIEKEFFVPQRIMHSPIVRFHFHIELKYHADFVNDRERAQTGLQRSRDRG